MTPDTLLPGLPGPKVDGNGQSAAGAVEAKPAAAAAPPVRYMASRIQILKLPRRRAIVVSMTANLPIDATTPCTWTPRRNGQGLE